MWQADRFPWTWKDWGGNGCGLFHDMILSLWSEKLTQNPQSRWSVILSRFEMGTSQYNSEYRLTQLFCKMSRFKAVRILEIEKITHWGTSVFSPNCKTLQRSEKTIIFIGTFVRTSNRTCSHVWQFTDVSKEHTASVFSVEDRTKQITWIVKPFTTSFLLVAWLVYSPIVKIEAVHSSETSANF